ncbi:ATP-binding protein [Coraliomargarita sp. SDUM461004]|uniref:histidine kinase n=1 Tax=Thalassobacterium sedimentorum TaxID=3041258 RepID=A0ABU1AKJ2_9BACT|nr:ATP-binding protein [Coraliomargarita sp. SDUM461004]MDQ8195217.1 ATP-binding protein [Coraliomargarita sp. SDUM461004]
MYFLILDVQGLYRDTQDISYTKLEVGRNLGEVQSSLSALELILDAEGGYQGHDRDKVSLNRLSTRIGRGSERIQVSAIMQAKLDQLKYDESSFGAKLREISALATQLSDGQGDPEMLYALIKETSGVAQELRQSINASLLETQERIEDRVEVVYAVVIGGMLVAIALTLAISTILWRRIIRPIEEISAGMEDFRADSERFEIDYSENDELGQLARSLEGMTARLKEYQELTNEKLIRSTSAIRSILDQSPDAFFIFSKDLQPTYFSPNASHLYLNSVLKDQLPSDVQDRLSRTFEQNLPQLSKEMNDAIRINVDGEEKWYLVHAFPFDAPDSTDFSYKSNTAHSSIAAIFQEATVLKLSDSLRKNLLATVSHELKTPITSARMSLYLLLEQQLGPLNADQLELVETARDDVNRQLSTIEHLLDLSRVEENTDQLELSEFSVCDLVADSLHAHQEIASAHDVQLLYTPPQVPVQLHADQKKVRIVLNNLLVNAIKYCGAGLTVEVRAFLHDTYCRVEVVDQGPGMDEETVSTIFDAYTRGNVAGAIKGTGLGLKISKDIIDAHHGRIGCHSQLDAGSTFFFELPI